MSFLASSHYGLLSISVFVIFSGGDGSTMVRARIWSSACRGIPVVHSAFVLSMVCVLVFEWKKLVEGFSLGCIGETSEAI